MGEPQSLVVFGDDAIGFELAQAYVRFGVVVTLLESAPRLLGPEEPSIANALADALSADGIDVRLGTKRISAAPMAGGARLFLDHGEPVEAERVLVVVGRTPNTGGIGFEVLGIDVDAGSISIYGQCRVRGQDHVWAAGERHRRRALHPRGQLPGQGGVRQPLRGWQDSRLPGHPPRRLHRPGRRLRRHG